MGQRHVFRHLKTPFAGLLQSLLMRGGQLCIVTEYIIEIGIQSALTNNGRVLTLQRTRSGIARISEQGFLTRLPFPVELFKTTPRHQHFTSNLKMLRATTGYRQFQRNRTDGLDIGCDIITAHSIATSHCPLQTTIFIFQRNTQTIKLQFATNIKGFSVKPFLHPLIEGLHISSGIGVPQRKHRYGMLHLTEITIQIRTDTYRR